jgi:hypothetical protein
VVSVSNPSVAAGRALPSSSRSTGILRRWSRLLVYGPVLRRAPT